MLIINYGLRGIVFPFAIDHIFVLVCASMKSKASPKENLTLFVNLSVELLKSLPLFPTSRDQNLVRNEVLVRLIDKIRLFRCARPVMYVAALRANAWHS